MNKNEVFIIIPENEVAIATHFKVVKLYDGKEVMESHIFPFNLSDINSWIKFGNENTKHGATYEIRYYARSW